MEQILIAGDDTYPANDLLVRWTGSSRYSRAMHGTVNRLSMTVIADKENVEQFETGAKKLYRCRFRLSTPCSDIHTLVFSTNVVRGGTGSYNSRVGDPLLPYNAVLLYPPNDTSPIGV